MDYIRKFTSQIRSRLLLILIVDNLIFLADWWIVEQVLHLSGYGLLVALVIVPVLSLTILPWLSARYLAQPTKLVAQAILHIAPDAGSDAPAPNLDSSNFSKEFVTSLVHQVYQIATIADNTERLGQKTSNLPANFVSNNLPLPLLILDEAQNIIFANEAFCKYLAASSADLLGKNVYAVLNMDFISSNTFDSWLSEVKSKTVTAVSSWERVRLTLADQKSTRQFDLAAYYNQSNPEGIETIMVLFDHSEQYSQDDQAMSLLAISVHELRTPLTLLRGYIEVFEDELMDKVDPELQDFMVKMAASAEQMAAFINNILNVARVDDDQLVLKLHEENWAEIIENAVQNLALRAQVRGIHIDYKVAPDLPSVGVDRVSILEVINNLVDNAIKYSAESKHIILDAHLTQDGLVETTVQDFGQGIPTSVMPNLFNKFYRNHRNRSQIGGTGLGLYLSRAIVTAHGGNIWVRSKEGQGTTLGFTLLPYAKLAAEIKTGDNKEIVRGAHGWIKNHSLYRR